MSRSYKKNPAGGITMADSEKKDKRLANRKYRRIVRQALMSWTEDTIIPLLREVSNVWDMDKDGKRWHGWKYPDVWRK
jgi:hypothetical protein